MTSEREANILRDYLGIDNPDWPRRTIKNAFTGEPMNRSEQIQTELQELRRPGLALKNLHDAEIIETGTGPRPRSRGKTYDIPPINGTYCKDMVDYEGKDAVDVNKLMERVDPSGMHFKRAVAQGIVTDAGMFYDDFIDAPDFQEAQNRFIHATQQFQKLDAKLRNRFDNDPTKFLQYMADPKMLEEQYNLGLRKKPEVPTPDMTNKDIVEAIKATGKKTKTAGKGGGGED